ncbi:MAG TPA: hypothetical protein VF549_09495 [Solirubrobacteraceae bacterium]
MRSPRSAGRAALLVGAAGALLLVLLDALVRDEPRPEDDDLIYERMADDPSAPHTYVFAFRVAVPWLVHVLPFSHDVSFAALAWIFSGAAGAVLFLLLDRLEASRTVSIPLAIALVVSPPLLVASLRQGRNPDPLTVLVMVTGALFIVERRPVPLGITMLVGAFNRESALFLAPLAYAVWADDVLDPRALRTVALAAAPAVVAFVTLRLAIPTVGRQQIPGYGGSLLGGRADVVDEALEEPFTQLRRLFAVYGPLWLVAPFALAGMRFARRGTVLVALCALACTFALDWGRILFIAAPVVYTASAWVLDRRPAWRAPVFALLAALVVGYAIYMQADGVQNLIDAGPPPYPVR